MLILSLIQNPILLIAFVLGLIVAITVHEYAHALIAYRSGDPTAKLMGRLTLNPVAHLDPIGTVFLFLVGFGWGKPVQTNPRNYLHKSDEIKVALSGIVANLLVATILAIPLRIALIKGISIDSNPYLALLNIVVDLNIVLAAFNVLPVPPLDGSHVVEYFLGHEARLKYLYFGPYILISLVIINFLGSGNSILYTIMEPVIRLFSIITKGTFSFFL